MHGMKACGCCNMTAAMLRERWPYRAKLREDVGRFKKGRTWVFALSDGPYVVVATGWPNYYHSRREHFLREQVSLVAARPLPNEPRQPRPDEGMLRPPSYWERYQQQVTYTTDAAGRLVPNYAFAPSAFEAIITDNES